MGGLFYTLKDKFSKKPQNKQEQDSPKKETQEPKSKKELLAYLNEALAKSNGFFKNLSPRIYSMGEESNIASKFNEKYICTKDSNLCMGVKLFGISYASANEEEELNLALARNQFFNRLDESVELNIIAKKELIEISNSSQSVKNIHAKEIINKWDKRTSAYKISYYLFISTKNKTITGFFESIKEKSTKEQVQKEENEQKKIKFDLKFKKLEELKTSLFNDLANFKPSLMTSDELLNFYATYANASETKLKYSYDLLTDCYITSEVEFKKDYIVFYTNESKVKYARFVSVKAYESDYISSLINTSILRENAEFLVFVHCETLGKEKAIKKIKDTKALVEDFIAVELDELISLLKADREKLILSSYSVLIYADDLKELDEKSDSIKSILENQSLSVVKETINQKALFFSFFPSRGNLNARMRILQSKNIATIINFENDILGFKKNPWGNVPLCIFKHLSGSPFLFNFHDGQEEGATGHTLVIGGTGYGKTTLMQFLMLNLFRYDINIFAMDKLRGMFNFANYLDCEYHDLELGDFKLNPFSLEATAENDLFLSSWLCKMGNIDKDTDMELEGIVKDTIRQLRAVEEHDKKAPTFKGFYNSLQIPNDEQIKPRFKNYLNSFFDNEEDALDFKKQLSILNMDAILKDSKFASLSALYLFHKIKNISKNNAKGFFIFIDELKDYLLEENMRESILEAILEIRKIGGVMTMGIQNIDFFNSVSKADSFINSMANYIIFPTNSANTLENLEAHLRLSGSELDFLSKTSKESRKILFKQANLSQSAVLDVNFSKLGTFLKIFSSNASDVKLLNELKTRHPADFRQRYLTYEKDKV